MKFSESWLRSFVNPSVSGDEFSHLLTMAGLEVEEETSVAPAFDNVIVAHVLEVTKHPDADRLNVCRVDIGREVPQQIVCGAPNVAPGLKVPCALPGASLPGDFTIKIAKVRGIESSGMLCSAKELGIAEDASGLLVLPADAPVGESIRTYLDLDDRLLTLKLTPNRADCLSLAGVAREVAALTSCPASFPAIAETQVSSANRREIILDATDACPLYSGRVISGVNARAATPEWMKRRLERSGIRSISALVDITNYVMLEQGQPLHAFDNSKLEGAIHARMACAGEEIQLLNEQTLKLQEDVLLIADDKRPLAMAGIMGGEDSGITLETQEMFLESAFFAPKAIVGRARRYGFGSDASHRFERGVDFGGTQRALERATQLIQEICGGQAGPLCEAVAELPARAPVRLRSARVTRVLGLFFSAEQIGELFTRLGLGFQRDGNDFIVTPPSYRFDIEIEEDLIEEIARLYGYDNIPAQAPRARMAMLPQTEDARPLQQLRKSLADSGFQEVINFAFVEEAWESDFSANTAPIRLANPIASQMSVMRSSLIGGLIANVITNLKRKQNRVRVFETGRCFFRDAAGGPVAGFHQPWKLAGLAFGSALPEQWGSSSRNVDFFDIKGEVERLLAPAVARFEKTTHPAFHPGRCARVILDSELIGFIGELHPQWLQKYDLPQAPLLFEIDMDVVLGKAKTVYQQVSKFQPARRDLAFVLPESISHDDLLNALKSVKDKLIQDISVFDVYRGTGLSEGMKSMAVKVVLQDSEATLTDEVLEASMARLVAAAATVEATLRA